MVRLIYLVPKFYVIVLCKDIMLSHFIKNENKIQNVETDIITYLFSKIIIICVCVSGCVNGKRSGVFNYKSSYKSVN